MRYKRRHVDLASSNGNDVEEFDLLSSKVIGCAIEVHKTLGPGLLESTYEECLAREMGAAGLRYLRQKEMPILYKGIPTGGVLRADFIVEDVLCVEIKAVEHLLAVHKAQLHTYLKVMHLELGLLINFNTYLLKDGIKRVTLASGL